VVRIISGMRQVDLAERSGVHQTYISLIERGKRNPGPKTIKKLEEALNADLERVFSD